MIETPRLQMFRPSKDGTTMDINIGHLQFFFGLMKRAKSTSRQTPGDFMVSFPPVTIGNGAKPYHGGMTLDFFNQGNLC